MDFLWSPESGLEPAPECPALLSPLPAADLGPDPDVLVVAFGVEDCCPPRLLDDPVRVDVPLVACSPVPVPVVAVPLVALSVGDFAVFEVFVDGESVAVPPVGCSAGLVPVVVPLRSATPLAPMPIFGVIPVGWDAEGFWSVLAG